MRTLKRHVRRWVAEKRIAVRRREVAAQVSGFLGEPVELVRTGAKGHDSVYYAVSAGKTLGVVRLLNPFLSRAAPRPDMPFVSLDPARRLDHEWNAYTALGSQELSPRALWRCHDATLCSYVPSPRFSQLLEADPPCLWKLVELAAVSLRKFHSTGLSHMDSCFANLLGDGDAPPMWIDFEYAPAAGIGRQTAQAYDYLRLVESSLKFLTPDQRAKPDRWVVAMGTVSEAIRTADVAPLRPALGRLLADASWVTELRRVFPKL
jgi:hypothetical protein